MKLKYVSWIPAVVMMAVIFLFSSKNAEESGASSSGISKNLVSIYEAVTGDTIEAGQREQIMPMVDFAVRKCAHGAEYAVFSFCVCFHLWAWGLKGRKLFLFAFLFSVFYASTDELHQLFVPGRSGQIRDVCIDSAGAFIGGMFFCILCKAKISICRKKVK